MTLHGHHHSYQRTCPVNNYQCQEPAPSSSSSSRSLRQLSEGGTVIDASDTAPIHLVIGNGGFELSLNVEPRPEEIWQVGLSGSTAVADT